MIQEMSAHKPVRLKSRARIKDNGLSPSSLELYDLMYLETCVTAEAVWQSDWAFCPVCMEPVDETGQVKHPLSRKQIEV